VTIWATSGGHLAGRCSSALGSWSWPCRSVISSIVHIISAWVWMTASLLLWSQSTFLWRTSAWKIISLRVTYIHAIIFPVKVVDRAFLSISRWVATDALSNKTALGSWLLLMTITVLVSVMTVIIVILSCHLGCYFLSHLSLLGLWSELHVVCVAGHLLGDWTISSALVSWRRVEVDLLLFLSLGCILLLFNHYLIRRLTRWDIGLLIL